MRWYKIVVGGSGGQTWDATGDPNALNIELDLAVTYHNAPANGNSSFVRVWGIPLQALLNARQFNNSPISIYGGMQQGLPLANPNQQGLLVQGIVYPALGNWRGTDMTLDFYIKVGADGAPNVPGAANLVHNQPAQQPMSTAITNALQTAFPGFTANVKISPNLVRPNDEHGFYQTLGQYATFLNDASHDIMKTTGYLGVQVSVQGKTINVVDGTQGQTGAKTINPQDLIGQPIWTNVKTCQFMTVMRGDINVGDTITLPTSLATLTTNAAPAAPGGTNTNIVQGSFLIQNVHHVGNFRQPDWSSWCTIFDGIQGASSGAGGALGGTPLGQGGIGHQ
jgi:hypothetical protein